MSELRRHYMMSEEGDAFMMEDPDGDWVRYDDIDALERVVADLETVTKGSNPMFSNQDDEGYVVVTRNQVFRGSTLPLALRAAAESIGGT